MYNGITEWAELFPNIYCAKSKYSFTHNLFAQANNSHWLTLWIRRTAITEADSSHTKDADRRTTHQWGELFRRTERQCRFSVYFRDQGDSLTKAVMVNTQQPTERGSKRGRERESIELDTEERIEGGWDALKVVYDNEGQFWITMLIRCKTRACSRFHRYWEIWRKCL